VSGLIQGTLNEDAVSSTPSTVTVTAMNNLGGSASRTFVWGTTPGPVNGQAVPVSGFEGIDLGFPTLLTFTTPDRTSLGLDYTAWVNWGDGSNGDVGVVAGGNGSFTVADDHTYAEAGTYSITVFLEETGAGGQTFSVGTFTVPATIGDALLSLTDGFVVG